MVIIPRRLTKSLDSTGFCVWVLPLAFSVLRISPPVSQLTFDLMKPEIIATHRTLFLVLIGLFEALLATSILVLWSVDPRRINPLEDAAGISGGFSGLGLFMLW